MEKPIADIRRRIRAAALAAGRHPEDVRLVAVSKTVPPGRIRPVVMEGIRILGENYIQEAVEKAEALSDLAVSWHFIGHLQRNKARHAVRMFDLIHTLDSVRLAREIDKQAAGIGKIQEVLVQVNAGGEATKSGVSVDAAEALLREAAGLSNIRIRGLMTIPPYFDAPEAARPYFRLLASLRDRLADLRIPGIRMDELSMGMTGDFEAAISEGATLVRIGTAIFGERT
jgi:hypothetical protein